jgi:hypothetical protein
MSLYGLLCSSTNLCQRKLTNSLVSVPTNISCVLSKLNLVAFVSTTPFNARDIAYEYVYNKPPNANHIIMKNDSIFNIRITVFREPQWLFIVWNFRNME